MIERFDANGNGADRTRGNLGVQHTAMFNSVDADSPVRSMKDELAALAQKIRRAERDQAREEMRAERKSNARSAAPNGRANDGEGKMGKQHAGRGEGMRGEGRGMGRHGGPSMERLDADKNGEVSADEFAAMETRMFERFDRNGDNKIDVTDFYRNRTDNN
jgi:hypothetical protein